MAAVCLLIFIGVLVAHYKPGILMLMLKLFFLSKILPVMFYHFMYIIQKDEHHYYYFLKHILRVCTKMA